jgi:hypothetical protein
MNTVIKTMACAAALTWMTVSGFGQQAPLHEVTPAPSPTPVLKNKTKRMIAIETKFKITMTLVIEESPTDIWVFMAEDKANDLQFVPVIIKADAKDPEIKAACLAVGAVADFYDKEIKKKAEAAPTPGGFR